ncbi:MAG: hypothetical protein ACRCZJ_04890 [Erysipelotrichaceae bacterium]
METIMKTLIVVVTVYFMYQIIAEYRDNLRLQKRNGLTRRVSFNFAKTSMVFALMFFSFYLNDTLATQFYSQPAVSRYQEDPTSDIATVSLEMSAFESYLDRATLFAIEKVSLDNDNCIGQATLHATSYLLYLQDGILYAVDGDNYFMMQQN